MLTNIEKKRFTLGALLVFTGLIAIPCAGWKSFGTNGIMPGIAMSLIAVFTIAHFKIASLSPINRWRMTVMDLIVCLAICLILHGLLQPAVQAGPHIRQAIPVTPVVPTPTTPNTALKQSLKRIPVTDNGPGDSWHVL